MVKLSEINISDFNDSDIDKIVYEGIFDGNKKAKYALVFGNSIMKEFLLLLDCITKKEYKS